MKKDIENVNKQRKVSQLDAGRQLDALQVSHQVIGHMPRLSLLFKRRLQMQGMHQQIKLASLAYTSRCRRLSLAATSMCLSNSITLALLSCCNSKHRLSVLPVINMRSSLQAQWAEGITKNQEIDRACQELEAEIQAARAQQAAATAPDAAADPSAAAPSEAAPSVPSASMTASSISQTAEAAGAAQQEVRSADEAMPDAKPPVNAAVTGAEGEPADTSAGADVLKEDASATGGKVGA